MDSFLQVPELLFKERVSDPQERECWQIHVDIVCLLQQDRFDANDLDKLEKLTKRWKHLMVKFYGGVAARSPMGAGPAPVGAAAPRGEDDCA